METSSPSPLPQPPMPDATWRQSAVTVPALAAALAKAQAVIEGAIKDSKNPHFGNAYADLASVWAAVRKPLTDNGLAIVQMPGKFDGKTITVTTMLVHSSGEWVACDLLMPTDKPSAQAVGSAITYARRYALAAFCGVCPEDDDGNAASGNDNGQGKGDARPRTSTAAKPTGSWA